MKITARLVAGFLLVMAAATFVYCGWQTYHEGRLLKKELDARSAVYSQRLAPVLLPLVTAGNAPGLKNTLDDFAGKERLSGILIQHASGNPVASSEGLAVRFQKTPHLLDDLLLNAVKWNVGYGEYVDVNGKLFYAHSTSLRTPGELYTITFFYDTASIFERVKKIWAHHFFWFFLQAVFVALFFPLIIYFYVLKPVRLTAQWIRRVRRGEEPAAARNAAENGLLKPVVSEVAMIAKSLSAARQAAEQEARLRQKSESVWTPARLREFVKNKLGGRSVFVVSNREPYRHVHRGKETAWEVPASGLVTAIEPILKACGGTWIAQADGDADRETSDERGRLRVPPEEPQYTLRRVWISEKEEAGFYYGFSNEGLWPLCHIAHTRPIFRAADWQEYKTVNEKFAKALLEEIEGAEDPVILVQDYHFALLPELVKSVRPDARVSLFWHIPWPNPESFGICPWQRELLKGMLGADIIGFHTQFHCNNFLATVDRFLESRIDYERFAVHREGSTTWVKPFPISIDFPEGPEAAAPAGRAELLAPFGISAEFLGVGVDRMDYTKGILERFRSIEFFLEKNPFYRGKFTFVEIAAPTRSLIPKYQEFHAEVTREAERINARFKEKNWKAIVLLEEYHTHAEILPFYRAADVCMVTSLHDGMNLVAKEFVMARSDEKGALILSQFTGAARELTDALIVNPYDIVQMADALHKALRMPPAEQASRMKAMRDVLRERNIFRWAADLVGELAQVRLENIPKHENEPELIAAKENA